MRLRWFPVLAMAAAAGALSFGSPALANTASTPDLHQTNVTLAGSNFDTCDGLTSKAGVDQWVFVWEGDTNNTAAELNDLNLVFSGGTRTEADVVGFVGGSNSTLKVIIETPAGWELISGTSNIDHTVTAKVGDTWVFNLTHGCSGTPGSPSPSPSGSESPSGSPTPSPSGSVSETGSPGPSTPVTSSSSGGGLPVTGSSLTGLLTGGVLLVIFGGAALWLNALWTRRRQEAGAGGTDAS